MRMFNFLRHGYFEEVPAPETPPAPGGPATPPPAPEVPPPIPPAPEVPPVPGGPATPPPAPEVPPPELTNVFEKLPDNWRQQALAAAGIKEGEDDYDKRMNQLSRVLDLGTLTKNYFEAQDKIRKGEVSTGLPENATDEQIAAYREANGIPESPDGYELKLDDGLVLGQEDERVMAGVFKAAHANNIPSSVVNELTNVMLQGRQAELDAIRSQDGIDAQTTTRQLKDAWGADFDINHNVVKGLLNQLPGEVRELVEGARMSNGKALFNAPEVLVFFADVARKLNPSATVVPNSSNPMQTMNDEIKTLEARMGTPEWYKDTAAQQRYQDLLNAREQMSKQ